MSTTTTHHHYHRRPLLFCFPPNPLTPTPLSSPSIYKRKLRSPSLASASASVSAKPVLLARRRSPSKVAPFSPHLSTHNDSPSSSHSTIPSRTTTTETETETEDIDSLIDRCFHLLRLSVQYRDTKLTRTVHAFSFKFNEDDRQFGNALISAYVKLGLLRDAFLVFKGISSPNVVSYTALMSGFAKLNREIDALKLFFMMRNAGINPNEYSIVAVLTACVRIRKLGFGLQIHGFAIKMGFLSNVFVSNALMGFYGKYYKRLDDVLMLFDEMPHRDIASWNTLLSSLVNESMNYTVFYLFHDMQTEIGFKVDYFTLSVLLTASSGTKSFMSGREIHAHAIRIGLDSDLSVNNALIRFYTKCNNFRDVVTLFERMHVKDVITWTEMITAYMEFGSVDMAKKTFDEMPEKNSVSHNALLAGFCLNNESLNALEFFIKMMKEGVELTEFALTSVVNACGMFQERKISEQIHGLSIKLGFGSNACIETAILDMCTKCGRMEDAQNMLHQWPSNQDNSIVYTSMLCGYARNGLPDEAISFFHRNHSKGAMILDEVSLTSVLAVCGTLGFLEMGEQIHCYAHKAGWFLSDTCVGNSVISMYSKCSNMDEAVKAFNVMTNHDIVSWNTLLAGHVIHRQGDEALRVWSKMEEDIGIKPDSVTFVLVITAYRHTTLNLVDKCRSLFFSMKTDHELVPTSEHYASFVRVLGHWGFLEEAEEIVNQVNQLPFKAEGVVWRALLDTCRASFNTVIGKRAAKHILALQANDPSTYILISNLYSASGRWNCSEMVRQEMKQKGFRKHPARSYMIHNNKVNSFFTRDKSHPQEKDIYSGLEILILECLKIGYVPDTSFVLHEVEEHQKQNFLFYHSAKLAVTYGVLMTKPGECIRIVKNIILCGDCHAFVKFVSVVTRREILVRDGSGFHCFVNGECSCKDQW